MADKSFVLSKSNVDNVLSALDTKAAVIKRRINNEVNTQIIELLEADLMEIGRLKSVFFTGLTGSK